MATATHEADGLPIDFSRVGEQIRSRGEELNAYVLLGRMFEKPGRRTAFDWAVEVSWHMEPTAAAIDYLEAEGMVERSDRRGVRRRRGEPFPSPAELRFAPLP